MKSAIVGALLGLGSTAYAVGTTQCQGDVCYSMNIPDSSTASTGTVYFQISGPTSLAWMGMGTGSRMSGAKMFVIYQSSNGQNVTLSPRSASGYVMPTVDSSIKATLLEGSGISNGKMVANIRCDSCSTSQSSWVYAYLAGSLKSDSTSASITQHSTEGRMTLDVSAAKGGSSTNPFGTSSPSGTSGSSGSSGTGTACRSNSGSSGNSGNSNAQSSGTATSSSGFGWWSGSRPTAFPPFQSGSSSSSKARRQSGSDDCSGSGSSFNQNGAISRSSREMKLMAHGIMAGLAFAVLFPFGAISIRIFSFPGLVWFHAGIQIFTMILFIIALALGVQIATEMEYMNQYHPVIGIVLLVLLIIQPALGQMHHRNFKKLGRRTVWSHGHLWLGRIIITLGIINGGLGFLLAKNTNTGAIAYAVVAAIFYIAYLGSAVIGERKRLHAMPPKYEESPRGSGPTSPREFYNNRHDG